MRVERLHPAFDCDLEARCNAVLVRFIASVSRAIVSKLGGNFSPSETSNRIRQA